MATPIDGKNLTTLTDIPNVGSVRADALTTALDIEHDDLDVLARTFFEQDASDIRDAIAGATALIQPLFTYVQTNDLDIKSPVSRQRTLEGMVFIRQFGCTSNALIDTTEDAPDAFSVTPADVDWSEDRITSNDEIAALIWSNNTSFGIPLERFANSATHIDEYFEGNMRYSYHEHESLIMAEYIDGLNNITGADYRDPAFLDHVYLVDDSNHPVKFTHSEWRGMFIVCPRIH